MNKIDWKFIGELEGSRLQGYVPDAEHSNSGVTIATGFDVGAMTDETAAKLSPALAAKLAPFRHLHKLPALHALHALGGLAITEEQAEELDELSRAAVVDAMEQHFNSASKTPFDDLDPRVQTVLASVTFQYGTPWERTPHFWKHATDGNWKQVHADLEAFGDKYRTRRQKEADYMAEVIKDAPADEA